MTEERLANVSVYLCDVNFRSRFTYQDAYVIPTADTSPTRSSSSAFPSAILTSPWAMSSSSSVSTSTSTSSASPMCSEEVNEPASMTPFEFDRVPLQWHCHGCTVSSSELLWWDDVARPPARVTATAALSRSAARSQQKRAAWRRVQQVSPRCANCLLCPRCGGGGYLGSREGVVQSRDDDPVHARCYRSTYTADVTQDDVKDDDTKSSGVTIDAVESLHRNVQPTYHLHPSPCNRAEGPVPHLLSHALVVRLTRRMTCYVVCDWCQWKSHRSFADMNALAKYTRALSHTQAFAVSADAVTTTTMQPRRPATHPRRAQRALAAALHRTLTTSSPSNVHSALSSCAPPHTPYHRFVADLFAEYYRLGAEAQRRGRASTHPAVVLETLRAQRHQTHAYAARYLFPPVSSFPVHVKVARASDYRDRLCARLARQGVLPRQTEQAHRHVGGACTNDDTIGRDKVNTAFNSSNNNNNNVNEDNTESHIYTLKSMSSLLSDSTRHDDEAILIARSQALQCGNENRLMQLPKEETNLTVTAAKSAGSQCYHLHPLEKECVTSLALRWQSAAECVFVLLDRDGAEATRTSLLEANVSHAPDGSSESSDKEETACQETTQESIPTQQGGSPLSMSQAAAVVPRMWAGSRSRRTVRVLAAQLSAVRCVPWLQCCRTAAGDASRLTLHMINLGSSDMIVRRVELKCQSGARYSLHHEPQLKYNKRNKEADIHEDRHVNKQPDGNSECQKNSSSSSSEPLASIQEFHSTSSRVHSAPTILADRRGDAEGGAHGTSDALGHAGAKEPSAVTSAASVSPPPHASSSEAMGNACAEAGQTRLMCNTRLAPRCTREQLAAAGLAAPNDNSVTAQEEEQKVNHTASSSSCSDAVSAWSCVVTKSPPLSGRHPRALAESTTSFFGLRVHVWTRLPVVQSLLTQGRRLGRRGALRGPLAEMLVIPDEASYRYHAVSFGVIVTW